MNNLYITCKNIKQRQDVFDVLTGLGYSNFGNNGGILNIQTDSSAKDFSTWTLSEKLHGTTDLTYQEFMDKHSTNQLKTKIEEVKAKLGLTQMQLSERIGKNPYYLDTVKHRGVTTERQNELMLELDLVANGGTVMTERELIASLSEQLVEAQSANNDLRLKLEMSKVDYSVLNDKCARYSVDLVKANISLSQYKRQYRSLVATVFVIGIIVILGLALWSVI